MLRDCTQETMGWTKLDDTAKLLADEPVTDYGSVNAARSVEFFSQILEIYCNDNVGKSRIIVKNSPPTMGKTVNV